MKKYFLIAALSTGLIMASGVSTVSADTGLLKLNVTQLDEVNAAGYKRRHYRKPTAYAHAYADAHAYGKHTEAGTDTWAVADSNAGYSGAGSASGASASGVWCGVCGGY